MSTFNSLNDLPRDIQEMYRRIRPNDYATAAASIRVPAIDNQTLLEAANAKDGVNAVRDYLRRAIDKFGIAP